jgi:hypothetical protein
MSDDYRLREDLQRIIANAGAAPHWNTASDKPVVPDRYTRAEVAAAVKRAIEACADKCTDVIRNYDVMDATGEKYAPLKTQKAAKGMVSVAREDIRALASDPAALERIINGGGE